MRVHLITALLAASLLAGCGAPQLAAPSGPFAVDRVGRLVEQGPERTLVEGVFTLPGQLVSVGSGSLVAVGSGNLVSVGSGQYRLQSVGDVPVEGAEVAIKRTRGADVGVSPTRTDASGRYVLAGRATAGLYLVEARHGGQAYTSLATVQSDLPTRAAVDVATTMVTARLLEAAAGELSVLPVQRFAETVAAVREAIAAHGLPNGFSAATAARSLSALEMASPELQARVSQLVTEQQALEQRYDNLRFQLQGLAPELDTLATDLAAALSENPGVSDEEVARMVTRSHAGPSAAEPTPAPAATPSPAPEASPTPAVLLTPAPESTSGVEEPKEPKEPRPEPSKKPKAPQPTEAPAESASPTPAPAATPAAEPTKAPGRDDGHGRDPAEGGPAPDASPESGQGQAKEQHQGQGQDRAAEHRNPNAEQGQAPEQGQGQGRRPNEDA